MTSPDEARAREVLDATEHSPNCRIHLFDRNRCNCDREVRAMLAFAASRPTLQAEQMRELIRRFALPVEDFINQPPRKYGIEPMEVRDYRHELYPIWSAFLRKLIDLSPLPAAMDAEEWVLVPREPTEGMFAAAQDARSPSASIFENTRATWEAMLDAAPPSAGEEG